MKSKLIFGSVFLIVLMIIGAAACAKRAAVVNADLERNRRLWEESGIVNYDFIGSWEQGGTRIWVPVSIKVRNGTTVSIEPVREKSELERVKEYENFKTVGEIFDRIQERYDNGDRVTVIYNKESGYPEHIGIEPQGGGVDTQFGINVSKFEIAGSTEAEDSSKARSAR